MLRHALRVSSLLLLVAAFGWSSSADAKPKKSKEPPAEEVNLDEEKKSNKDEEKPAAEEKAESEGSSEEGAEAKEGDGEKKEESGEAAAPADSGTDSGSPVEVKDKAYYFIGARLRMVVVPAFIIEAFGDGGEPVIGPSFGPEFAIRKNGFETVFAASYTAYPMQDVPFKAPSDPQTAMELVTSEIKVLYLTADFYWSKEFSPSFAFIYGGGAGLGIVWGPLYRAQAYPVGDGWAYCPGPPTMMNPGPNPEYCSPDPDLETQHYQGYSEPNWFDGGSKPVIMPWLNLQVGLRFKPHRAFVARADLGIGLGQIFLGLGADYGL